MGKNEKSRQENTKRLGLRHVLLTSTALFLVSSPALGQVAWEGDVNGRWTESGNWTGGSVPTVADEVIIDAPAPVELFITVINGEVGEADTLTVGDDDAGYLALLDGGKLEIAERLLLGYELNSSGAVVVADDAELIVGADIMLGRQGNGTLIITGGGAVRADSMNIGNGSNSESTVEVQDGIIELTSDIVVGGLGQGELRIEEDGYVKNTSARIGLVGSASSGLVIVDGGEWENTSWLAVGHAAQGRLEVLNGGTVTSVGESSIGNLGGSSGTVLISGSGSSWTNDGVILVGREGAGRLTIEAGGHVESGDAMVGGLPAPDRSHVTIDDGTWDLGSLYTGLATIEVSNSAVVTNDGIARLGNGGNRHTELTISNSEWTTTGQFEIGWESSAEVLVVDGGKLETGAAVLGDRSDTIWGSLMISDLGSTWTASGDITLGNNGKGTLTISNEAEVFADGHDIYLAQGSGSESVLNIGAAAGEIEQDAGFLTADSIIFVDGSGTLVFNHTGTETDSYTFDIDLESTGTGNHAIEHLVGVTNYTGDGSDFTGTTTISGGRLYVNNALGGLVDVNGGVLGGIGTLGDVTINSGGTIAPGNSIGTLHVLGNVVFNAGSTYEIEIAAPDQADLISAEGSVTIDGGELAITALDTGTSYAEGQTYRVIEADDGVIRNTDFLHNQPVSLMRTEVIYGADFVDLLLSADIPFTSFAQTYNQFQTAAGLQDMDQSGDALTVYNEIVQLSLQPDDEDAVRRAFNLASGEVHASSQHVIDQTFGMFSRTLRQQGATGLGGGMAGGQVFTAPLAYGPSAPSGPGIVAIDGATTSVYADSRVANAWLAPLGGRGTVDADANAATLDWWAAGIAGGYEGTIDVASGDAYAGFGLGYIRSHSSVDARLSSFDSDGFHIGAYGGWSDGPWTLAGSLAYAANSMSTERRIVFGGIDRTATADYWNHTIGLSGEAAYGIDMGSGTTLLPLFTLDAGWSGHGGFTETGAGALNLTGASKSWTRLDTGIGLGVSHVVMTETGRLVLEGRAVWEHAFADVVPSQSLSFAGSPTGFTANGPAANRDRLRLGAGLGWDIAPDMTLRANYDGVFAGGYDSHTASLGLNIRF